MIKISFIILTLNNLLFGFNNSQIDSNTIESEWLLFQKEHMFKSAYVVFAGPYPTVPSSSFGHLFLLLEPKRENNRPFLLWDVIDYSANVNGLETLEIYYKGLIGGLFGAYRVIPFYEKIREYTFIESRALWIFPIELNDKEMRKLTKEIFLLKGQEFAYRFYDKNCASQIEVLLHTAINDTLINPKGVLISPRTVLSNLGNRKKTPKYIRSAENIINKQSAKFLGKLTPKNIYNINNLDTSELAILLNIMEWKYSHKKKHLTIEEEEQLNNLRLRNSFHKGSNTIKIDNVKREFDFHPTMQIGGGIGFGNSWKFEYLIKYRFGLHEFYENNSVYPKNDFLTALKIELLISEKKIEINEFVLFNQLSLHPSTKFTNYLSWGVGFGAIRRYELQGDKMSLGVYGGIGKTYSFFGESLNLSFLLNIEPLYLMQNEVLLFLGPEIITIGNITNNITFFSKFGVLMNTFENFKANYYFESKIGITMSKFINIVSTFKHSEFNNLLVFEVLCYLN